MKETVDFYIDSPYSYLVMSPTERFWHTIEDRRIHLMTILTQAREQKMAKEQLQQLMEGHASRKTKLGSAST